MKILLAPMAALAETGGPSSRVRLLAGVSLAYRNFNAEQLAVIAEKLTRSKSSREHAAALGKKLTAGGGVKTVVAEVMNAVGGK